MTDDPLPIGNGTFPLSPLVLNQVQLETSTFMLAHLLVQIMTVCHRKVTGQSQTMKRMN
jgi:hypothetical protein